MRLARAISAVATSAALIAAALPAAAGAATLEPLGQGLQYNAADGEVNHVELSRAGDRFELRDTVPIDVRADDCTTVESNADATVVRCSGAPYSLYVSLGYHDDHVRVGDMGDFHPGVEGGPGSDTLEGGPSAESLSGGPGDDTITGGSSPVGWNGDNLSGGAGNDTLTGSDAGDDIYGGLGKDEISGGDGYDDIWGGENDDVIESHDPYDPDDPQSAPASDSAYCGPGTDLHLADEFDESYACERAERPSGTTILPPPSSETGPWENAVPLVTDPLDGRGSTSMTLTPRGEALVVWQSTGDPSNVRLQWAVKRYGTALSAPAPMPAAFGCCVEDTAADGEGNVVAIAGSGFGTILASVRPPGGDFGEPTQIGSAFAQPMLVTAGDGDMAALWKDGSRLVVAFRPSGGEFGPPIEVKAEGSPMFWRAAALSENGDLAIVWADRENSEERHDSSSRLFATVVEEDATIHAPEPVSSGERNATWVQLAADAHGRFTALWNEAVYTHSDQVVPSPYISSYVPMISQRGPGGTFGSPRRVGREDDTLSQTKLAMSASGLVTVAHTTNGYIGRVFSAQYGEPLKQVRAFDLGIVPADVTLVSNRSGLVGVFWHAENEHLVSAFRSGTGDFGRVEDVRPECEHVDGAYVQLNEAGQAAALLWDGAGPSLALADDTTAKGRQDCSWHDTIYTNEDPDAPPVSRPRPPPDPVTRPPGWYAPDFRVSGLSAQGRGLARKVHATIRCSGPCRGKVRSRITAAHGKVLAGASKRIRSKRSRVKLTMRLKPRKGASRRKARRLSLKVSLRGPRGKLHSAAASVKLGSAGR